MKTYILTIAIIFIANIAVARCPYDYNCINNPYGVGSPYYADSINNPYGVYGSQFSNKSPHNPYATNAPKIYDAHGNYRGRLSSNPYDPESISNPHGIYGSQFSSKSINNPHSGYQNDYYVVLQ